MRLTRRIRSLATLAIAELAHRLAPNAAETASFFLLMTRPPGERT